MPLFINDLFHITLKQYSFAKCWWLRPVVLPLQEAETFCWSRQKVLKTLPQKYQYKQRADGVVQVLEYLPNKHETLNSNPNTIKKHS
jgi:hypothetical protein